jgi:DNA adenine methylase
VIVQVDTSEVAAPLHAPARPLLKWAGGKRQLLEALGRHYPAGFARYVEPFLGSGAVFFDLLGRGRLSGRPVRLIDVNPDLIGCYRVVRDRTAAVIDALSSLDREYRATGAACYYDVRDRRFNPARARLAARAAAAATDLREALERRADGYTPELAAMLIFLNRTGFNGLFRVNRRGGFNVPAGRYDRPVICDAVNIRAVASAFAQPGVTLECRGFEEVLAGTGDGDFVYCDPPYAPLSRTSSFAHYTAGGFTALDQRRLQQQVFDACRRGALVLLSNSSAGEIVRGYSTREARRSKLEIFRVPARRAINSRSTARGVVEELIITNVGRMPENLGRIRPRMLPVRPRHARKTA